MIEHLVEGHLGSYYISTKDPDYIEEICPKCNDYDEILTSWDNSQKNARTNAIVKYLMRNNLNNKKDIEKKIEEFNYGPINKKDIIYLILEYIYINWEEAYIIVSDLYENNFISEEEYYKILHISNIEEDRQNQMVMHYTKSIHTKDNAKKVNINRLIKRRKKD